MSLALMAILSLLPSAAQDNTLTEDEKKAGWKLLFDGKSLDGWKHGDGKNPLTSAGSIYAVYPPAKKVVKPVGEWNHTKIVAKGNHIEHWLNGEKVCEA